MPRAAPPPKRRCGPRVWLSADRRYRRSARSVMQIQAGLLALPAFARRGLSGFESVDDGGRDAPPIGHLVAVLLGPFTDRLGLLPVAATSACRATAALHAATGPPRGRDVLGEVVAQVGRVVLVEVDLVGHPVQAEGDGGNVTAG